MEHYSPITDKSVRHDELNTQRTFLANNSRTFYVLEQIHRKADRMRKLHGNTTHNLKIKIHHWQNLPDWTEVSHLAIQLWSTISPRLHNVFWLVWSVANSNCYSAVECLHCPVYSETDLGLVWVQLSLSSVDHDHSILVAPGVVGVWTGDSTISDRKPSGWSDPDLPNSQSLCPWFVRDPVCDRWPHPVRKRNCSELMCWLMGSTASYLTKVEWDGKMSERKWGFIID